MDDAYPLLTSANEPHFSRNELHATLLRMDKAHPSNTRNDQSEYYMRSTNARRYLKCTPYPLLVLLPILGRFPARSVCKKKLLR